MTAAHIPGATASPSAAPNWTAMAASAAGLGLELLGGFHPRPGDGLEEGTGTLLLLGPDPAGFWPRFSASPEARDGRPDPVDRWSERVIGGWAREIGARALFPFGTPPYRPFIAWALRTGRIHHAPIRLLVHDRQGLMVSFRGALALPRRLALPPAPPAPCAACAGQPCRTACPVGAFDGPGYEVAACKAHVQDRAGRACREGGCLARRACPVSAAAPRPAAQSHLHMKAFLS